MSAMGEMFSFSALSPHPYPILVDAREDAPFTLADQFQSYSLPLFWSVRLLESIVPFPRINPDTRLPNYRRLELS